MLFLAFSLPLAGVAGASQGVGKPSSLAGLSEPGPKYAVTAVPDPQSTKVHVYIFNKSTMVWPQAPVLPVILAATSGARPAGGPTLAADPALAELIKKYSQQHGVDPKLVQAIIRQESGFNPAAVSPKGAMGLMQLMPETAASLGVEDPFDLEQNLQGGIRYLKLCLERFDHNLPLALAAYNAGPGRVMEYQGMPPFKETHTYVTNVVLAYHGHSLNLAQVKLAPLASLKVVQIQPDKVTEESVPHPPALRPLDLSYIIRSSLARLGSASPSPAMGLKRNVLASVN